MCVDVGLTSITASDHKSHNYFSRTSSYHNLFPGLYPFFLSDEEIARMEQAVQTAYGNATGVFQQPLNA